MFQLIKNWVRNTEIFIYTPQVRWSQIAHSQPLQKYQNCSWHLLNMFYLSVFSNRLTCKKSLHLYNKYGSEKWENVHTLINYKMPPFSAWNLGHPVHAGCLCQKDINKCIQKGRKRFLTSPCILIEKYNSHILGESWGSTHILSCIFVFSSKWAW